MDGKAKIEALTNAWYGYTLFAGLVNVVGALLGARVFGFVAIPIVVAFSVFSLFVAWVIGRLLLNRSRLTRLVVLVLSAFGLLLNAGGMWRYAAGPWNVALVPTVLVMGSAMWMQLRTLRTLLDRRVTRYFA